MALSNAERQRRYRARVKDGKTPVRYRRPKDNRSRARRWRDAVATLLELQDHHQHRNSNEKELICPAGDRDRLYDPGSMEDRMYLGMRGAVNEFELSLFRKRSLESRMAKAARGELFLHLPAGYNKVGRDVIEMSADQRIRDAIRLVFDTFDELGSVRQTWLWFRNEQVEIPVRTPARGLHWRIPTETSLHSILRNPIYAGTCAYGRKRRKTVIRDGRKQILQQPRQKSPEDWFVLLHDRHEGNISWQDHDRNQAVITSNRTDDRGAVRPGRALLAGLLRCGRCQRRIQVRDNGKSARYLCFGATGPDGNCLSFGAVRVDEAVGQAVIEALQTLAMETAGAADRTTLALARSALSEARLWTPPLMQAFPGTVWCMRSGAVVYPASSIAALQTPRACMEIRGSGPNRLRELNRSAFGCWFSRPRLVDRLPLPVLRPAHIPDGSPHIAALSGGGGSPASLLFRHQRPDDARHSVGQCHRDEHPCVPASWRARDPRSRRGGTRAGRQPSRP